MLDADAIDLVQLHCPPTDVYYRPEVFEAMDGLVQAGKIRHYGVSVERVEEALKAMDFPGVASVQIIYNLFRQRPADIFLAEAARRNVGVLARLPLSSGLLTGKLTAASTFDADDHRHFNRNGEQFDRGETFSGLDLAVGLDTVERLRPLVPTGQTMAQFALRWILMAPEVTCVIPGARTIAQVDDNTAAADAPSLSAAVMTEAAAVYDEFVRRHVHARW
jgi:aryl-alcohol dehydrogenase-like predicted oxidoreductase